MSATGSLFQALPIEERRSLRAFAKEARRVDGDAIGPNFYRDVVRLCDAYEALLKSLLAPTEPDEPREPSPKELGRKGIDWIERST